MRWLVNYFRSVICKHDWEREDFIVNTINPLTDRFYVDERKQIQVSATCKKCGWHKSYPKI